MLCIHVDLEHLGDLQSVCKSMSVEEWDCRPQIKHLTWWLKYQRLVWKALYNLFWKFFGNAEPTLLTWEQEYDIRFLGRARVWSDFYLGEQECNRTVTCTNKSVMCAWTFEECGIGYLTANFCFTICMRTLVHIKQTSWRTAPFSKKKSAVDF